MILFDKVSKRYPNGHEALSELSLHVARGEMVFLTGHSGAGKSTLLKLIMLMERPTRGQVVVNGTNLRQVGRHGVAMHRRNIGVVFQDHQLLPDRSVYDNVALPLLISGCSERETGRRVRAALDKVGLLHRERDFPMALSGGEQQRVGIARAVTNRPALLLADEPTGNLDSVLAVDVMGLFEEFNRVGVTVVVATHDLALVARMRHRLLTLRQGRLVGVPA
jgi:cell division transport system ATP-binding protein